MDEKAKESTDSQTADQKAFISFFRKKKKIILLAFVVLVLFIIAMVIWISTKSRSQGTFLDVFSTYSNPFKQKKIQSVKYSNPFLEPTKSVDSYKNPFENL